MKKADVEDALIGTKWNACKQSAYQKTIGGKKKKRA